jgi:hypothetical protein
MVFARPRSRNKQRDRHVEQLTKGCIPSSSVTWIHATLVIPHAKGFEPATPSSRTRSCAYPCLNFQSFLFRLRTNVRDLDRLICGEPVAAARSVSAESQSRLRGGSSAAIARNGDQPAKLRRRKLVQPSLTTSMQNSSLSDFFGWVYLAHFDVVTRKLIFE